MTSSIKNLFNEIAELKAALAPEIAETDMFSGEDLKYFLEKVAERVEHLEGTLNKLSRIGFLG